MRTILIITLLGFFTTSLQAQNHNRAEKAFQKALKYGSFEEYDRAHQLFDVAMKQSKKTHQAKYLLYKGMTYHIEGKENEALKIYRRISNDFKTSYYSQDALSLISLIEKNINYPTSYDKKYDIENVKPFENKDLTKEPENIPFSIIETIPIYQGCEVLETNEERKKCMSSEISKVVSREFDSSMASTLDLSGRIQIVTQFKINTEGIIIGIRSRSNNPYLALEAERVVNSLPQMKPGYQKGKAVTVIYALPIIFEVTD